MIPAPAVHPLDRSRVAQADRANRPEDDVVARQGLCGTDADRGGNSNDECSEPRMILSSSLGLPIMGRRIPAIGMGRGSLVATAVRSPNSQHSAPPCPPSSTCTVVCSVLIATVWSKNRLCHACVTRCCGRRAGPSRRRYSGWRTLCCARRRTRASRHRPRRRAPTRPPTHNRPPPTTSPPIKPRTTNTTTSKPCCSASRASRTAGGARARYAAPSDMRCATPSTPPSQTRTRSSSWPTTSTR